MTSLPADRHGPTAADPLRQRCLTTLHGRGRDRAGVCDEARGERVDLSVVDAAEHPARARENDVVALPTLVRVSPRPLRHLVGNLTDPAHVRAWLDQVLAPAVEPGAAVEGDSVP